MVLPPASNGDFPTFEIKLQAHALSKFTVDKREIGKLSDFFLDQRWKGELRLVYPGNGGISLITFEEKRPMSELNGENGT
jgi:hypothetical protein